MKHVHSLRVSPKSYGRMRAWHPYWVHTALASVTIHVSTESILYPTDPDGCSRLWSACIAFPSNALHASSRSGATG
ncbi:hypothetical protein PSAB6_60210 [Paraburkholderia sabiae]|nr:hypothetical protein PSAB6_60210 [Paraburkholderia sabiae]